MSYDLCAYLDWLDLGETVASTDYAVRHFLHPWHPRFFGNGAALRKAVRRGIEHRPAAQRKDLRETLSEIQEASQLPISESSPSVVDVVLRGMEAMRTAIASLSESQRQDFLSTLACSTDDAEYGDFLLEQLGYKICFSDNDEDYETWLEPVPEKLAWLSCPIPITVPLSKPQRNACASILYIAEAMYDFLESFRQVDVRFHQDRLPLHLEWLAEQVAQIAQ